MVSLPASVMMREQAAWFQLTAKFPQLLTSFSKVAYEHITNLKDVWKYAFTETMALKLGKVFEFNSSPFQITVNVSYKDDEAECACLSVKISDTSKYYFNLSFNYLFIELKCALKHSSSDTNRHEFFAKEFSLGMQYKMFSPK